MEVVAVVGAILAGVVGYVIGKDHGKSLAFRLMSDDFDKALADKQLGYNKKQLRGYDAQEL